MISAYFTILRKNYKSTFSISKTEIEMITGPSASLLTQRAGWLKLTYFVIISTVLPILKCRVISSHYINGQIVYKLIPVMLIMFVIKLF